MPGLGDDSCNARSSKKNLEVFFADVAGFSGPHRMGRPAAVRSQLLSRFRLEPRTWQREEFIEYMF